LTAVLVALVRLAGWKSFKNLNAACCQFSKPAKARLREARNPGKFAKTSRSKGEWKEGGRKASERSNKKMLNQGGIDTGSQAGAATFRRPEGKRIGFEVSHKTDSPPDWLGNVQVVGPPWGKMFTFA